MTQTATISPHQDFPESSGTLHPETPFSGVGNAQRFYYVSEMSGEEENQKTE